MCGIAGIFDPTGNGVSPELLSRMTGVLRHRGPDDEGYLLVSTSTGRCEPRAGDDSVPEVKQLFAHLNTPAGFCADLALGHRRLSIIDLSAAGHQPMSNEDGTAWIVHNGEVYNYAGLREELRSKGHRFRSNTDTEVILHSYEEWGPACLNRFNGMWAFAIWDGRQRKLFCSRDRFGIKPFYYSFNGTRFLFASEIKALLQAEFVRREPNEAIINWFLDSALVDHTEETFFAGIRALRGGHYLELSAGQAAPVVRRFYDVPLAATPGLTDDEYARRFYELFEDSVRLRLVSDVPVGSCLSGGLDSSSIVCVIDRLMCENGVKVPGAGDVQRTFSARYDDRRHDEGRFINDVVNKTGVRAGLTYPTAKGLWNDLPDLIWHQEEPFGSTSIYAQWEVFKLFKESGVKVALDGQGADELLAGYSAGFLILLAQLTRSFKLPDVAAECLAYTRVHGPASWRSLLAPAARWLIQRARARTTGTPWSGGLAPGHSSTHPGTAAQSVHQQASLLDRYLHNSIVTTSIPGLLRYEDKNSMAHSIESRVPFLDYRLVEYAFSLPWPQKISNGTTKMVLRRAMSGILPESVARRQDKIGFSTPEDSWFRHDLRDEISEIIESPSFRERPFFDMRSVRREWEAHRRGRRDASGQIWRTVSVELWMRMFIDKQRVSSE